MQEILKQELCNFLNQNYSTAISKENIIVVYTKYEHNGDFTLQIHQLSKKLNIPISELANNLKIFLSSKFLEIEDIKIVGGFLNLKLVDEFWIKSLKNNAAINITTKEKILVEFLSPNTNKPLHLGHIRNSLLGDTLSRILKYTQNDVIRICLFNNRGIHICQSMLAWKLWNKDKTPKDFHKKGDHFIGDLYVQYHSNLKKDIDNFVSQGFTKDEAQRNSDLYKQTYEMLQKWEEGDEETISIWQKLNNWVYEGFFDTLKKLNIEFDELQYESDLYKFGKELVLEKLKNGIVVRNDDNSVSIDLTDVGLDNKILIRSDGTSVYITQDIGTIIERYNKYKFDKHIYVVGNEQEYHFKVLKEIIKRFGFDFYDKLYHYSYGMIELPEGKMKSREGKIVDADDLIQQMIETAKQMTEEKGKMEDIDTQEYEQNIFKIAIGAIKYHILKIEPRKNILFNPQESIDFNGNTGPFIQYTCTRINTLLIKSEISDFNDIRFNEKIKLSENERILCKEIYRMNEIILQSANDLNPAILTNYIYNLSKFYNNYYQTVPILKEQDTDLRNFRIYLSFRTLQTLKTILDLLGIEIPTKM